MFNQDVRSSYKLAPYQVIPEEDHCIVEHMQTGEFYEMPRPAIEAMKALEQGDSLEHIERELLIKYPDEEIDMIKFLGQLQSMGFLLDEQSASNHVIGEQIVNDDPSVIPHSAVGRILFHKHSTPVYAIVICANILFFISRPDLFPRPHDLFPFDSMMLNIIASFIISITLLAIHESGHVLSAKAAGLKTSVRISHRLMFPVVETQMPTIWRLPRRRRNIPLLAGLFMDHSIMFICLSMMVLFPSVAVSVMGILGMIVLELMLMSFYQCMFFMKTDIYYLIQNITGSYNLLENAEDWLKDKLPFIRRRSKRVIYDKEKMVVRGYAIFYIVGLLASGVVFVLYVIPQLSYSFSTSFERLLHPYSTSLTIDAILFFLQIVIYVAILLFSWRKKLQSN